MASTDADRDQDNFSSVSWSENADAPENLAPQDTEDPITPAPTNHGPSMGPPNEDHTLGSERLDCTVGTPIKENDGSKDAFVSYLITTHVRASSTKPRADHACDSWAFCISY
jgi:sorting nexin-4